MTYNEWRDELKGYLLSVSESERKRVLDYYAEAYADRREAGFSEKEIIDGFGAPYDAAQRILDRDSDDDFFSQPPSDRSEKEQPNSTPPKRKNDRSERWLFVLVCILLAPVLVGVAGGLFGLAVALVVTPVGIFAKGIGGMIGGIVAAFQGNLVLCLASLGLGLLHLGVSVAMSVLAVAIVKKLWVVIPKAFRYLKDKFLAWRDGR